MIYTDIIAYLRNLGAQHKEIKYTAYGDFEEILGAQRAKIVYPALWIESPSAKLIGGLDSVRLHWEVAFVILINAPLDDFARKQANIDTALKIMNDFISRVRRDVMKDTLLDADINNSTLQYVYDSETSDADQGWRFSFIIHSTGRELCYDPTHWLDTI